MPAAAAGLPATGVAPVIETDRLRLRAHRVNDYAECLAIWSDPEVTRYIGGRPSTAEEVWARMLRYAGLWQLLGYGYWAVEVKDSGRYIGDIGYADFKRDVEPPLHGMLEFGWILAPHAHGHGYASEAVAAASAWAKANIVLSREVCMIAPQNTASIRVAEKAGFHLWQETSYHDSPTIVFSR